MTEQLHLTNSSMSLFRSCRYRWWLTYVKRLTPKLTPAALEDGSIFHDCLEMFYKGESLVEMGKFIKKSYKDIIDNLKVKLTRDMAEGYEKRMTIMLGMIYGYCNTYDQDMNEWEPVYLEKQFEYELHDGVLMTGKIDGIMRHKETGKLWLWEHKTAAQIGESYVAKLPMDSQLLNYITAAYECIPEVKEEGLAGVVYNVTRKPSIRPKKNEQQADYLKRLTKEYTERTDFYYYREQLKFERKRIKAYKRDLKRIAPHIRDARDDPKNNAYKNYGYCTQYGLCQFMDVCIAGKLKGPHMDYYYVRESEHAELSTKELPKV